MNAQIWKDVMKQEGEPVLLLSLRLPTPAEDCHKLRRLRRYYIRLGALWKARWEGVFYSLACDALKQAREESRPFQPWSATVDFTVLLESVDLLSLFVDITECGPTPRPLTVRIGDVWNLTDGTPLTLRDSLPTKLSRHQLIRELQRQTTERVQSGESLFYQDAALRVRSEFSPCRFYLSETGPMLFFPMLSLGSAGEGIPVFSLDLKAFLPEA